MARCGSRRAHSCHAGPRLANTASDPLRRHAGKFQCAGLSLRLPDVMTIADEVDSQLTQAMASCTVVVGTTTAAASQPRAKGGIAMKSPNPDNRMAYEQPIPRETDLRTSPPFLVGHAYIGNRGAKELVELVFPERTDSELTCDGRSRYRWPARDQRTATRNRGGTGTQPFGLGTRSSGGSGPPQWSSRSGDGSAKGTLFIIGGTPDGVAQRSHGLRH